MPKMFFLLSQMLLIGSCQPSKVLLSDLEVKEFKYHNKKTERLFTGTVISNFDNGNLSNTFEIKEGIPNGKWVAYGYKGEILQEGTYTPVDISSDNFLTQRNIKRLNICFGKEGSYNSTDIYVIVDTTGFSIDTVKLKQYIIELFERKNILPTKDTINDLVIIGRELN